MSEGLGAKIKELRLNQNMTQAALGKLLNVSQVAVYKWEKQLTEPDTLTLIKLANLFNVLIDYLLGATYDPTPRSQLVHKNTIKTEAMINVPIIKIIAIDNRLNPKAQKAFMSLRYWNNLNEFEK